MTFRLSALRWLRDEPSERQKNWIANDVEPPSGIAQLREISIKAHREATADDWRL